jgi:hypothetical protein
MKRFTIPIRNLPSGLSGHIEVTETPANRDRRDTAIGIAAVIASCLVMAPYVFLQYLPGILVGSGVFLYVARAAAELRIFTRRDRVTFDAIVEHVKRASTPEGDGSELMPLLDLDTDVGAGEARQESA